MVSLSNNTQGNVNITTRNSAGVNLTSNNDTDVNANMNGNAQRAKSWAVGEGLIDGVDYSAKHYAQEAKKSEEIASHAIENIDTAKDEALDAIDDEKTEATADMETAKSEKISEIENTAADFEDDLEALTTRAETAATNAETSETNAAASATSASTSATSAESSATLAWQYRGEASNSASAAWNSENRAERYKNAAETSKTQAADYASQASNSATSASTAATIAAQAQTAAENAAYAAESYAQQAEQAKEDIETELDNYVPNTRKVNNKPLSADITLTASDVGALANSTKYGYSIELSLDTTNYKLTLTLKDQDGTTLSTKTVDFPIESVVVNGSYDSTNQKIVLTLQSGSTIDIPVGDLVSGLQTEITSTNKLDADLVDDSSSSHKFATAAQLNQIATNTSNISSINANYLTINTAQDVSGRKTFLGEKAIYFKQSATTNKLGFTLYNPSSTELGAFEWRPSTIGSGALLNINVPYSSSNYVGFRYWGTAVNIIAPKVATAGNYYIPTHITNGSTTVTATNAGVVNISTLLPDVSNFVTNTSLATTLADYQPLLVSGTNIKTINNESILGSGNISIQAGGTVDQTFDGTSTNAQSGVGIQSELSTNYQSKLVSGTTIKTVNSTSLLGSGNIAVQPTLVSGTNIKTVNNTSLLGSGNIDTSEIFVAEYGTTSYADVQTAISSGKVVFCDFNGVQCAYVQTHTGNPSVAQFRYITVRTTYTINIYSNNNWAVNSTRLATTSDIPTVTYDSTTETLTFG